MALPYHNAFTGTQIHTPYRQEFADTAAREAYTVTADDIASGTRKKFLQIDNLTEWLPIATGAGAAKWSAVGLSIIDTDVALAANSDALVPSQKAVKAYVDGTGGFGASTKADVLQAAFYAADTGAADAYVATLSPAITAYVTGTVYRIGITNANTGASTIDLNSLGAKTIKKVAGGVTTDLAANDLRAGQIIDLVYDGTNMQLQSTLGNAAFTALTKADVLQAAEFAADAGANDTYAITLAPAITAYVTGARYRFKANTANAGAATLNINAVGAQAIKKVAGGITTALDDNDIRAGQWVEVVWDGTNFQMLSQVGNVAVPATTPVCIQVACSDETTALTTGDGKVIFRAPYAFTLTSVRGSVTTAPTGGTLLTIDITEAGTTVLSTLLTFDASEKTTTTAATPAVISDAAIADDAEISINIDAVGSTVAGAGLKVTLIGTKP